VRQGDVRVSVPTDFVCAHVQAGSIAAGECLAHAADRARGERRAARVHETGSAVVVHNLHAAGFLLRRIVVSVVHRASASAGDRARAIITSIRAPGR
jgi:hypothetical protein